ELVLVDVRVQGDDAAPGISRALRYLSRHGERLGLDAVLLTRGGGSIEDLWAFNERGVADAIYECALPVVAAIGHETDTTIAELVADLRCATPTQAAMTLVPDRAVLADQVEQLGRRLSLSLGRRLEVSRHRLDAAARHPLFQQPQRLVDDARRRVDQLEKQLLAVLPRRVAEARRRLEGLSRTLDAVSPQRVLQRGYSYTLGPDGKLLRSAKRATPGTAITTVLADGRVNSVVDGSGGNSPTSPAPLPPKPRRKPRKPKPLTDPDGQPTLFA
ncbi:MAG: exodeoxyribonuclease VII large subunit, partial [Planctomycetota bacterium]